MQYISSPSRLRRNIRDLRSFYYYGNKAVRQPAIRHLCFRMMRFFRPKARVSVAAADIELLKKDGIIFWEKVIDAATIERIRLFLLGKPVYDIRDLDKKPLDLAAVKTAQQIKLKYFDYDIVQSEDIMALANNQNIIALITAYFGCKPTVTVMDAWWTKTGSEAGGRIFQDDMYHRDVEDFKFIKLFVYLTDVLPDNGAHCFVKGSHRSGKLTERMPIDDETVARTFDSHDRIIVTGRAGSGFLEDTWGLHRSLPAKQGERLLISITYSLVALNPWSPRAPLMRNIYQVDPYINRVYLQTA